MVEKRCRISLLTRGEESRERMLQERERGSHLMMWLGGFVGERGGVGQWEKGG